MTASLTREKVIKIYRQISENLADPFLISQVKKFFNKRYGLPELLEWIHSRMKFNKGDILRHTDPFKILSYGEGKCREFSILFTAICLANGYRARIILDMSDHAWTEVWDSVQKTWVHVDPSEKRINDPWMYERDWKKELKEVYAFERGKRENVTLNYKISRKREGHDNACASY